MQRCHCEVLILEKLPHDDVLFAYLTHVLYQRSHALHAMISSINNEELWRYIRRALPAWSRSSHFLRLWRTVSNAIGKMLSGTREIVRTSTSWANRQLQCHAHRYSNNQTTLRTRLHRFSFSAHRTVKHCSPEKMRMTRERLQSRQHQ